MMHGQAARQRYPAYDPVHLVGTLRHGGGDGRYAVDCDGREWLARRAASCLLAPAPGDTVLISGPDPERVYLIAVIEQADPACGTLEVEGRLRLRSRTADVAVQAAGEVRIEGGQGVRVETDALSLRVREADCSAARLSYLAGEVEGAVGCMRLVGRVYEAVVDRLSFLSRLTLRQASEAEHVRAGTLDYQAGQSARLHAPYTMVTADALVKVDARQVHMG